MSLHKSSTGCLFPISPKNKFMDKYFFSVLYLLQICDTAVIRPIGFTVTYIYISVVSSRNRPQFRLIASTNKMFMVFHKEHQNIQDAPRKESGIHCYNLAGTLYSYILCLSWLHKKQWFGNNIKKIIIFV